MAWFDTFKKEELAEIERLKALVSSLEQSKAKLEQSLIAADAKLSVALSEIEKKETELSEVKKENLSLGVKLEWSAKETDRLRDELEVAKNQISKLKPYTLIEQAEEYNKLLENRKSNLANEISTLDKEIREKKSEIVELDDTILLQDYGLYSPVYDFASLDEYKNRLADIRNRQKDTVRNGKAAICTTTWTVNNSIMQGTALTNQNIKQIVRCFNDECDVLVGKVKFNNITAYTEKVRRAFTRLNEMNSKSCVRLTEEYLQLKIEELQLAYEYECKKNEEKERLRQEREILREEARVQKEIEEKRRELEKERAHYNNWLEQIERQLSECDDREEQLSLEEKKSEFERQVEQINEAIKDVDYREANKRAGYVYVISNIGSFGENIYKIGMTRRLDPTERVAELGGASVPFKFDIHAIMFSDDAPTLETALHHRFRDRMVNLCNNRKEFFRVSLDEIKEVIRENYDKTVDFINMPIAEQYRETLRLKEEKKDVD